MVHVEIFVLYFSTYQAFQVRSVAKCYLELCQTRKYCIEPYLLSPWYLFFFISIKLIFFYRTTPKNARMDCMQNHCLAQHSLLQEIITKEGPKRL